MTQTTWTETDALAPKGPSLAQLMLDNGAQLATVAPRTAEQAVTAAEVIAEAEAITEDVAVIEVGEVPAEAPCSHASCAHADPASPCVCTFCIGAGHGWITARAHDAGRTSFDAKVERLHGGNIFATVPAAPADELTGHRFPGLAAVAFDADGWPID